VSTEFVDSGFYDWGRGLGRAGIGTKNWGRTFRGSDL